MSKESAFPYVTRMIAKLYTEGRLSNVKSIETEPRYGYINRLTYSNGQVRITRGNDVGLNIGASQELANDKGYTRFFLESAGVQCPQGETFLLDWWAETIRGRQHRPYPDDHMTVAGALEFVNARLSGYPVYVKPANGSQGRHVWCCRNSQELIDAFHIMENDHVKAAVVEQAITYQDSRIVILDGRLISAYTRYPLSVVGDGFSTISELGVALQGQYLLHGRDTRIDVNDPRIVSRLRDLGMSHTSIPPHLQKVQLHDISNLSAGGTAVDVTEQVSQRWIDLGARVAASMGLRLCGIDLACDDITSDSDSYSVIEVNATPGLDHYVSVGAEQQIIVENLYQEVLNAFPKAVDNNAN